MEHSNRSQRIFSWLLDIALFLGPILIATQLSATNKPIVEFLKLFPFGLGRLAAENALVGVILSIPIASATIASRHCSRPDDGTSHHLWDFTLLFLTVFFAQAALT